MFRTSAVCRAIRRITVYHTKCSYRYPHGYIEQQVIVTEPNVTGNIHKLRHVGVYHREQFDTMNLSVTLAYACC